MKKFALLLAFAMNMSDGFVVRNPVTNRYGSRALSSSALLASLYSHDIVTLTGSSELPRTTKSRLNSQSSSADALPYLSTIEATGPKMFELPKNAQPFRADRAKVEALLEVEMNIGRFAMIAAAMFLFVEMTTGKSLPEQIVSLM